MSGFLKTIGPVEALIGGAASGGRGDRNADNARAREAAEALAARKEAASLARTESLSASKSARTDRMNQVGDIQGDLGSRLGGLRENRQFLSDATAQPYLQQISEQEGASRRQVGLEGSLGDRRRSDIANRADLQRQNVKSQSFGQQIQSEQGLLQLQNDFSAMFNEMANTQFSQELSGLGEEIDLYMAEKGRDLKYADFTTKAKATSERMMGRLASGLANAFDDDDDSGLQR